MLLLVIRVVMNNLNLCYPVPNIQNQLALLLTLHRIPFLNLTLTPQMKCLRLPQENTLHPSNIKKKHIFPIKRNIPNQTPSTTHNNPQQTPTNSSIPHTSTISTPASESMSSRVVNPFHQNARTTTQVIIDLVFDSSLKDSFAPPSPFLILNL